MSCRSWWRSCTPRWPRWRRRYTTGRSRSANRTLRSVCSSSVLVKLIRRYCRVVLKNVPGHTCFQSLRSPAHKPEPGIRRENENSRGNEKRRSRKRYIFREKKIDKHSFFIWNLRWWICECKLKVQNWYSSWILVCCISSNMPPEWLKLHRF